MPREEQLLNAQEAISVAPESPDEKMKEGLETPEALEALGEERISNAQEQLAVTKEEGQARFGHANDSVGIASERLEEIQQTTDVRGEIERVQRQMADAFKEMARQIQAVVEKITHGAAQGIKNVWAEKTDGQGTSEVAQEVPVGATHEIVDKIQKPAEPEVGNKTKEKNEFDLEYWHLKEVSVKGSDGQVERGWYVAGATETEVVIMQPGARHKAISHEEFLSLNSRIEIERREKELSAGLIQEAKEKRIKIIEERGLLQIPKEEFAKYFLSEDENSSKLKQQNVGDCYAVAALHALSCSPHFEMIVRSSMKKLPDGSWEVKMPLLNKNGKVVNLKPEDIIPQENANFGMTDREGKRDQRKRLLPLNAKEGFRILEAAFMKHKFGNIDRLRVEGGSSEQALIDLCGENFKTNCISTAKYDNKEEKLTTPPLESLSEFEMAELDNFLENFDPEIHIATASSGFADEKALTGAMAKKLGLFKRLKNKDFFVSEGYHAYSVSRVDKEKKIITLANPWDTSKPLELSFDQFKGLFYQIITVRVDSAKLLKNMDNVIKKSA